MPPKPKRPERPEGMQDDSDTGSEGGHLDDGTNKSSSSQVRKAQNRIAQREFRLRKQQYVRDLEARVEVLSGDKEDRVELMTLLIRNLLKENKDLRDMVKTMASFVGDGLGSCLPRLGLSAPQLDAILTRADTDTAYEAFINLKASAQMQRDNPGIPLGEPRLRGSSSSKRKRASASASGDTSTPHTEGQTLLASSTLTSSPDKRARPAPREGEAFGDYAYLFPDLDAFANAPPNPNPPLGAVPPMGSIPGNNAAGPSNAPWGNTYPPQGNPGYPGPPLPPPQQQQQQHHQQHQHPQQHPHPHPHPQQAYQPNPMLPPDLYNQPFSQSGFGLTLPPSHPMPYPTEYSNVPQMALPRDETERQRELRAAVANLTSQEGQGAVAGSMTSDQVEVRRKAQEELRKSVQAQGDFDSDRKTEAVQLITYHLNNFRVNHAYSLPSSLRPTKVQRTIPHEHAIDGLIFPSIRDRMILLRGRYDLVDAFHGMLNEFTIHGQDVLDHHNWEVSEKWLRDFKILADDDVYQVTNKWRAHRGDPPLIRSEMGPNPPGTEVGLELWRGDAPAQ